MIGGISGELLQAPRLDPPGTWHQHGGHQQFGATHRRIGSLTRGGLQEWEGKKNSVVQYNMKEQTEERRK